ncbi:MAG: hypothetical protein A2Z99_08535 [Treponema sp. GWB1_62_6]|nr:MAG: hypothetical protein A2001_08465 [Treponema sp. GWC1_61_84]OHE69894.1 MAG: hypothetical protein A2Z99_08535 [Treponema sp. GWB1_62_6]OHE71473.1 MAG: hypothetical protein A2413_18910 [Treponema sp. RIFOXYC1_FULL_61_9]HCM25574.1 hypothetical protein [Treponema sp.]
MTRSTKVACAAIVLAFFSLAGAYAADPKAGTLTCVGLYSETDGGYVSWKAADKTAWAAVKVGDVIPANAEIRVFVERDWIEVVPSDKPNVVFELTGSASGTVTKKVADILKEKGRTVELSKGTPAKLDSKLKDKLQVTRYLGRQIFMSSGGDARDIKYGDVLELKGKVKIIAINNTIDLMNAAGAVTTVVGPLSFTVEQVLTNKSLYKFLNVQK